MTQKKIEDLTTLEDKLRVLAGFILDQKAIPADVLDTLDSVQMVMPWLRVTQEKADQFDAERRGAPPEALEGLRDTARYLNDRGVFYRKHADAVRERFPVSAGALEVVARAADRQANHLRGIIARYYPKESKA